MAFRKDEALVRVGIESRAHINAARESNADSAEHVRQSRKAIERSLRILAVPVDGFERRAR